MADDSELLSDALEGAFYEEEESQAEWAEDQEDERLERTVDHIMRVMHIREQADEEAAEQEAKMRASERGSKADPEADVLRSAVLDSFYLAQNKREARGSGRTRISGGLVESLEEGVVLGSGAMYAGGVKGAPAVAPISSEMRRAQIGDRSVGKSPWQDHVRRYRAEHPDLSYKQALKGASATYGGKKRSKKRDPLDDILDALGV